jgi:N-methylhydantoinase B
LQVVPPGDRVIVSMPGGGGMGAPSERDPAAIRRDIRLGYITEEAARLEYGFEP